MFKKKIKVQNSHSVSNKDKKKMKEQLLNNGFGLNEVETLLDDKKYDDSELTMEKLQGLKTVIFSRIKTPLFFSHD